MLTAHTFTFVFPIHLFHTFLVGCLSFFLLICIREKMILTLFKMVRKTSLNTVTIGASSATVKDGDWAQL